MSIYNEFNELYPYIQSIRKLKTYLSFDMSFPKDWKLPKKYVPQDSVIENKSTDPTMRLISFGVEFNEDTVNTIVDSIKNVIKYNREIEEKELLFGLKVQELKNIFEKQNLIQPGSSALGIRRAGELGVHRIPLRRLCRVR
jgi:hypothetical protein